MVDHLQSRVMPWRQYASHVKVRGTLSKMDVCKMKSNENLGETSQTRKKAIGKGKIYVVEESDCVEEVSSSDSDSLSDQDIF